MKMGRMAIAAGCAGLFLSIVAGGTARARRAQDTDQNTVAATSAKAIVPPIDPQRVQDEQDMTWEDYHPIPGKDWAEPSLIASKKQMRIALVAIDFPDQPFVITLPKKSDLFGNPQVDPVTRDQVPQFYADFFGKPEALNHGHTLNGYWMEQSRGQIGVAKIDAYGPYRMPKKLFQYGLNEWGQQGACPSGYTCDGRMERDADELWRAAAGQDIRSKYDIVLRIYAGYDETSVWQEFGEMKFQKDNIPAEWGNPDTTKPRWAPSRYTWTTWKAAAMQWGLSSIRQGESSGTITHEISHFAFRVGDNNNNPYAEPYHRAGSGPWDIMDRGSFNGPGGPHMRWVVPATEGASMPAGLMLRSKINDGFLLPSQVLKLSRDGLAKSGLAVATVTARAWDPGANGLSGVTVKLDGAAPQDKTPACDVNKEPLCSGPGFNFYSIEVVQRIGYDSFTPDHGVLLAKNKDREGRSCGYNCFTWVIDAHPEDIHQVDYVELGTGKPVMRTMADYRQLNDALFHAGLDSGSQYEWEDTPNRLHFYVLGVQKDAQGILSYTVGVRSLDGSGPQKRGVALRAAGCKAGSPAPACKFTLKNTGAAADTEKSLHPEDATAYLQDDIYRLSVSVEGKGWTAQLQNALAAVKFGESVDVPIYVAAAAGSAGSAQITLKAQSESDPTKVTTAKIKVKSSQVRR